MHHLSERELPAARAALLKGWAVACLSESPGVGERVGGTIRVLPPGPQLTFADGVAVPGAFDLIEAVARELALRQPAIMRFLGRLAGSDDVDRYLCRCLTYDVGTLLALALLADSDGLASYERIAVDYWWPERRDLVFISRLVGAHDDLLPAQIAAALSRLEFRTARCTACEAVADAAAAIREAVVLWGQCLRQVGRNRHLPTRPLLLRSYDWDWAFDFGGRRRLRNVDFLVDGEYILPNEVGIWLEEGVPPERRSEAERRGYVPLSRVDIRVGPVGFAGRFLPTLLASVPLFARLASVERWWLEPVRRFIAQSLLWQEVARQARPRIFVAYNDLLPAATARTLALRRAGCLTVEYEFSSHWRTNQHGWIPDYVHGFAVLDALATWGRLHTEHIRNHHGAIGEFWEVGCLWSEHARLVAERGSNGTGFRDAAERAAGVSLTSFDAVVGVFDTSTSNFYPAADMVEFYAGVAELAHRMPRVLFLCKPKRPIANVFAAGGTRGGEIDARMAEAPNVAILHDFFETAAVVGLSHLSVNACYTSPAVESIGLGRPAIYYDPTELFPNSFFRRIPRLVATNEDELAMLVEELLTASAEERARDVRERLSQLEGHLDGRAITRMRERLRAVLDG